MARNGWGVDPKWLKDLGEDARQSLPVCGHGWDATCRIQMSKSKAVVVLTFSGTNPGYPLIAVEPSE